MLPHDQEVTGMARVRWTYGLPALYLAFAVYAWIDITYTAYDGLTNLGLMLVTSPVTALGLLLT